MSVLRLLPGRAERREKNEDKKVESSIPSIFAIPLSSAAEDNSVTIAQIAGDASSASVLQEGSQNSRGRAG